MLDGGAHFYGTYETKDGKFVSVGSIEPQFYELLLEKTGPQGRGLPAQMDRKAWAQFKSRLEHIFREQDARRMVRDHGGHRHLLRAGAHHEGGVAASARQGARRLCRRPGLPAARRRAALLAHQGKRQGPAAKRGQHTDEVLRERGFSSKEIGELKAAGIVGPQ